MSTSLLETLARLSLSPADRDQLGLSSGTLELRRSWPRREDQLHLEYVTPEGRIVPGQWFRDPARCADIGRRTARAAAQVQRTAGPGARASTPGSSVISYVLPDPASAVLLQANGSDRKLPALLSLLARPGARLLVHRPERRAVVRLVTPEGVQYAKVVPAERLAALVAMGAVARAAAGDAFATPALVAADHAARVAVWSALPGEPLIELLGSPRGVEAAQQTGAARRPHALPRRCGGAAPRLGRAGDMVRPLAGGAPRRSCRGRGRGAGQRLIAVRVAAS